MKKYLVSLIVLTIFLTACRAANTAGNQTGENAVTGSAISGTASNGTTVSQSVLHGRLPDDIPPGAQGEESEDLRPEQQCKPEGWKILDKAKGSYGDEGYRYLFVIYQSKKPKYDPEMEWEQRERKLTVIKEYRDGNYEVVAENENAVLREEEGGVWGDPYESIKVKNGKFILTFYGGSGWRWWECYTFRLGEDAVTLMKWHEECYHCGITTGEDEESILQSEGGVVMDTDYEKGIRERKENKDGKLKTKTEEIGKQSIDIGSFNIYDIRGM